jgi:RimJ/RimL family protein N-acetyltransferase
MTPDLETERLLLKPLKLEDAEQTQLLFPQWEIVQYLNARVPWPYPPDGVRTFYRDVALPAVERGDEWAWTLRLKTSPDKIIGALSLSRVEHDNRGFWLAPEFHGRGLMVEAVFATNDFWFDVLGFKVLRVPKAVANVASRRISEKTGMRVVATEERDSVCGRLPSEIWEVTAEEWHAFRAKKRRLS